MKKYIEETLRQEVDVIVNIDLYKQLPFMYKAKYNFYDITISNIHFITMEPKMDIGLVELRKDRIKFEKLTDLNCVILFYRTSFYIKEKLIEEGIPFVIKDKQVYLPFLGYLITQGNIRDVVPIKRISYLTQKILLMAIYENWKNMSVTQIATILNVSKMSISRCFDELEYLLGELILTKKGKSRTITIPENTQDFYKQIQHILRNPVISRYELVDDICLEKKAGISALEKLSLIADNDYPTYAITKNELQLIDLKHKKQVREGQNIGCVVLELGYYIDFHNLNVQDPISILHSLSENEKQDERIVLSVKAMLEEYVWLKD